MLNLTAIGHIGKDAVLRETTGGKKAISFSIAHTEKYKNASDVPVEKTTWLNCTVWDKEALAQYLKKGTQVYIEGKPEARPWQDKQGEAQATIEVTVYKLELLGGQKEQAAGTATNTAAAGENIFDKKLKEGDKRNAAAKKATADGTDDLPF